MKEVNTILEMLIESRTQLLEAKARIKEREEEINKDLSDCYIAITALTPKAKVAAEQPQEQTEQTPKVGDVLVAKDDVKDLSVYFTPSKEYKVMENNGVPIICDDIAVLHSLSQEFWSKYFRFADEQPTSEDMSNLHSYLHVNGGAKKPYRIKTRQEMIDGGAVEYDGFSIHQEPSDISWVKDMDYLQGRGLETNESQEIDGFTIEPWMITENK